MFQTTVILFAVINLFVDLFYLIYASWLIALMKIKLFRKGPNPLLQESVLSGMFMFISTTYRVRLAGKRCLHVFVLSQNKC